MRAGISARITRVKSALVTLPDALASTPSKIGRIVDSMWVGSSDFESAKRPILSRRVGAGALGARESEA